MLSLSYKFAPKKINFGSKLYSRRRRVENDSSQHKNNFMNNYESDLTKNNKKGNFDKYLPRTRQQIEYVKQLENTENSVILGIGPAGTGKSLFACVNAIHLLRKNEINKIILTRPLITVENEELGFLPGNVAKKMEPWTKPLFDVLTEFYKPKDLKQMLYDEVIEICPLAYMRGRTFKNTCIIADEMQNSTPSQMVMLLTRIGEQSKVIVTGDLNQSDRCTNNGLLDLLNKLKNKHRKVNGISLIEMTNNDIQRSEIVNTVLRLYDEPEPEPF